MIGSLIREVHCEAARVSAAFASGESGSALVGDAGMKKDPITAQGIGVAFEYAQKLADAIDAGLAGRCDLEVALAAYEQERDERLMPFYEFTVQLAKLAAPTPELLAIYQAVQNSPDDISRLFGCVTLSESPSEFFSPDNVNRIVGTVSP